MNLDLPSDESLQPQPSKVQPSLLRQLNERQVLAALQTHGALSRAEIARRTGISSPTVNRVVASLLEAQLVEEDAPRRQSVGRPGKLVHLATRRVCVLGCVVGPKVTELVRAGLDGSVASGAVREFPTPATFAGLITQCVGHARQLMAQGEGTVLGLGISVPGLLNRRAGRSIVSPNLHQIDGRNLGAELRDCLQIDASVIQECHALCLAEQVYGEAKGVKNFAMLDISEGLGLGVIEGGRLLQGHSGLAGELGHVTVELDGKPCGCGNRGCLETVATDMSLAADASARLGRPIDIHELIAEAREGRLQLDAELDRLVEFLAVGVAAVINIFNPSRLFIYGRCLDAREGLFEQLLAGVRRRALAPSLADCQIVRARGNKRLGAVVAAVQGVTDGWQENGQ